MSIASAHEAAAALDAAAEVLLAGAAVVLPTDTVYGLTALPTVAGATARLFELKGRHAHQPLAVLVADVDQALGLITPPAAMVRNWMAEWWPGPLTIVCERSAGARAFDLGAEPATVGVRCPAHHFVRALATRIGPLATTSANRSGQPTPSTAAEAAAALTGPVALVIDGGPAGTVASTVVDTTGTTPRLLRESALSARALGLA